MSANRSLREIKPGGFHATGGRGRSASAFAQWYRKEIVAQWEALDLEAVQRVADIIVEAQEKGRQVFVMGNGGSAATASHMATDLCKTAERRDRPMLKCISLTDNVAFITAIGNDLSFDDIFERQLMNLLNKGDTVILISGSGNSRNMIKAAKFAKARGAKTIGLLGFNGGKLMSLVDIPLLVPSEQYGVIEDLHIGIGHVLTFFLKQR